MMQYFDEIWSGNCFRTRGYIVHVPSFLAKARKFAYQETDEYEQIDSIIRNADLIEENKNKYAPTTGIHPF